MYSIGIDAHKRYSQIIIMKKDGKIGNIARKESFKRQVRYQEKRKYKTG